MTASPSPLSSDGDSLAAWVAAQPANDRERLLREIAPPAQDRAALAFLWPFWARPKQVAPSWGWATWLICAGRGFGKTRTGAEEVRRRVGPPHVPSSIRIALVGRTAADVRDVMIEGESGILETSPPWNRPRWQPSKRRLTWPNGAQATTYSADKPDQVRGPQHDFAWADELAAWRYPDTWDQLQFGLRLGPQPQCIVTTTPRPTDIVRELIASSRGERPTVALTRGSTYENRGNLPEAFLRKILAKYEGTRLGRQELHAEVLDDTPGALWTRACIEKLRARLDPETLQPVVPDFVRVVVAIDPAVSDPTAKTEEEREKLAETGIVVVALARLAGVDHVFVLADLSGLYSPLAWANAALGAMAEHEADCIVAEANNGGALVESNIRQVSRNAKIELVYAARGKQTRAEPVAGLYEQGRVHHVGVFAALEDQMCTWQPLTGMKSPDRLDALVWGVTKLLPIEPRPKRGMGTRSIGTF